MKTTKFKCLDKCEETFQELKRQLTIAHILVLPIEGKEYTTYSNVSKNGLGCVLIRDDKVVAYAS